MGIFDLLAKDAVLTLPGNETQIEIDSVCKHLNLLLNSRRGTLAYIKGYGLPDIEDIYNKLPKSRGKLAFEIKNLIEKYEPRMKDVLVTAIDDHPDHFVVRITIQANLLNGQTLEFNTHFSPGGKVTVSIDECNP
jgi:type VI secretion system protein